MFTAEFTTPSVIDATVREPTRWEPTRPELDASADFGRRLVIIALTFLAWA